jgi:hypothetical protein
MGGMSNSSWNMAHAFGLNPSADGGGGGRNVTMSATRIHRLRALAIQKLAQAYKADEIASSVMVMQGGTVFDDVAERVLRVGTHMQYFPTESIFVLKRVDRSQRRGCEIRTFFP